MTLMASQDHETWMIDPRWNVWIVGDTVAALKFGTTEKFPAPVGLRQQLDDAAA